MEFYKLNLPNGVVNNINEYYCDEEDCDYCYKWRCYQNIFKITCKQDLRNKRNVEEHVLACVIVYHDVLPKLKDVKQTMRISEKKYNVLESILWMLVYEKVEDVKEHIKLYIESQKLNVKNTVRDLNRFVKLTFDYNKRNRWQLNYDPEIKL